MGGPWLTLPTLLSQPCVGNDGDALHLQTVYNMKKKFSSKTIGMACHTPPLNKANKQGEMSLPSLSPIPLYKNVEFRDGMGHDM